MSRRSRQPHGRERAIGERLELYRTFLDASGEGMGWADLDGAIQYANNALASFIGVDDPAEVVGLTVQQLYDEATQRKLAEEVFPAILHGGVWRGEIVLQPLRGEPLPTLNSLFVLRDDEGEPLCFANVVRDLTEVKRAEQALARYREHLEDLVAVRTERLRLTNETLRVKEHIIESASVAIVTADLDGRVTYVNPSFLEMWGFDDPTEVLGTLNTAHWDVGSRATEIHDALLSIGKWSGRLKAIRKDGTLFDVEVHAAMVRGAVGEPLGPMWSIHDVSERLRAEERFRLAARQASDLIYEWDVRHDRLLWFGDIDGALGHEPGEIPHELGAWFQRIHPEDLRRMGDVVELHRTSITPFRYEYRVQHRDGTWRVWDDRGVPLVDPDGRPRRWIGVCSDITARMHAEKLSQTLRDLAVELSAAGDLDETLAICLKTAIDVSLMDAGGIYLLDEADGALVLQLATGLGDRFVEAVGRYEADSPNAQAVLLGKPVYFRVDRLFDILQPRLVSEGLRTLAVIPVTNEGRIIACINVASHHRDDVPEWVRNALETMASQIGSALARALARARMLEQQEMFRALAESSADTIMRFDRDHRHLYANPIVEARTGIPPARFVGQTHAELGFPEHLVSLWGGAIDDVFRTARTRRLEFELPSGVWIDWLLVPEFSSDGTVSAVITSGRDITERKRAEAERAKLEEQLRQSQKMEAIGRLAGGVAHDFNNILTGIIGYSEVVAGKLDRADPLRQYVEEIGLAGERAAALTRQLLAFSRKQVIAPAVIQPNDILARSKRMLARIIGEDVELCFELHRDLWRIEADPGQLDQILVNLAVNARDAMPDGGRLVVETRNVDLDEPFCQSHPPTEPGHFVLLAVSDDGRGMDDEVLAHVFEPFYSTKRDKGTGLGLSTVYGIVQQNGGTITVSSEVGTGTRFEIYFPRAAGGGERPQRAESTRGATGSETVLLVEDEEIVRSLARKFLEYSGFTVLEARSGSEALALAEEHHGPVDLLLTDVIMPGMNGRELYERLQETLPDLKALFMSGYTDDVIAHHGVLDEGTAFLQKPFTIAVLTRRVREVLDS